ncbi:MAG: hypothetical protein SGILL_006212 [Bacillariaceae sp.]
MSFLLVPLQILLIVLDFLASIIFDTKWIQALTKLLFGSTPSMESVPLADDPAHRVHKGFEKQRRTQPTAGGATLYEIANHSFTNHADQVAMKKRQFLGMEGPKKPKFGDQLIEYTYKQVGEMAHKFGAALVTHGMVAAPDTTTLEKNTKSPCRMAIFENTCAEWMISCLGAFTQGITVTTVYATLVSLRRSVNSGFNSGCNMRLTQVCCLFLTMQGIDAVSEAVSENAIPVIVCNKKSVKTLLDKKKEMPSLKVIVYTNDYVAPDDTTELPKPPRGVQVFSFDEFIALGDMKKYPATPPTPESTAVIMYTSGSTGKPKGVVITHKNVTAAVSGPDFCLGLKPGDKYIGYLPLAHILELTVEFCGLSAGASVGYCDPKTLTTGLGVFKPTHMVGVPKIWDTIRKGVMARLKSATPLQQAIAETGMKWKGFCLSIGLDTPLFNAILFDKFKSAVGGDLRWALSGGGPLSGETQLFARICFSMPLVQAYGLTESTATVSMQCDEDLRAGIQGVPFPSTEVKLASTPEIADKGGMPYMSTDRMDVNGNPCCGRGEILIKGPNISIGYYDQPEKTKEVYLPGGWFATGDIGQFNADGTLSIVDRKKNLVKLNGGEYVALEKMETVYSNSDFVDALAGGVCVYADGEMDRPVAFVELNKKAALDWAKANGVNEDIATLKDNKELNKAVLASMQTEHANSDLSRIEKIVGVVLLTTPWTPENGCLTAANKLQRRTVLQIFPKEFEVVKEKGIFK